MPAKCLPCNSSRQSVHGNTIGPYERFRGSGQSRHLAWRVLQELRLIFEIPGEQRIPYEGEMKRFRSERRTVRYLDLRNPLCLTRGVPASLKDLRGVGGYTVHESNQSQPRLSLGHL